MKFYDGLVMSKARELYAQIHADYRLFHHGNHEAVNPLSEIAELWRRERRFFSAAICMIDAFHAAWGTAEVHRCLRQALDDLEMSFTNEPADSLEGIAALDKWVHLLIYLDPKTTSRLGTILRQEMAQRLMKSFARSKERNAYLVRGFVLATDLDGNWSATFPDFEVSGGSETRCGADLTIALPSAFSLLCSVGDYAGAHDAATLCPDAFTTPGLRGWGLAVRGFLSLDSQAEYFAVAADAFAEDTMPQEPLLNGRSWDSANVDLWAKYFRARVAVARIPTNPSNVVPLLQQAAEALTGTESGWVNSQVSRFRLLIGTLLEVLERADMDVDRILKKLRGDQWLHITPHDPMIEEFVRSADEALQAFRVDPGRAIVEHRLSVPLELLGRIPLVGQNVKNAIAPAIAETAVYGPQRTWIYRTLEALTDEVHLRKVILRLEQAQLPLFAQLRHGPLEYGKDLVAVFEKDGKRTLQMWQAKIGDMNIPKWREARHELEEMYLVPLSSLQVPGEIDEREGILVFNGHANTHVEPVMQGWLDEQARIGHRFRFMHLDNLVHWIIDNRLITELRKVFAELGIEPVI